MAGKPRRDRLRAGEGRAAILAAARNLFAAQGYRATTTQQIAERADISETLIFYHFSSKQALFVAAIVDPLSSVLSETVGAWDEHHPKRMSFEDLVQQWVQRVFDRIADQRELLRPLLAVAMLEPDVLAGIDVVGSIEEPLRLIGESVTAEFARRGLRQVDPALAIRLSFLSIAAAAMFLPSTYRDSPGSPGHDIVVAELCEIFVRAYRPL
jgi:AcrR family transcriptional regulator